VFAFRWNIPELRGVTRQLGSVTGGAEIERHDSTAPDQKEVFEHDVVCHSVGAHTESLQSRVDSSCSSSEDEASQAPAATTSAASESATAAAASTPGVTTAAKCVSWCRVLASQLRTGAVRTRTVLWTVRPTG